MRAEGGGRGQIEFCCKARFGGVIAGTDPALPPDPLEGVEAGVFGLGFGLTVTERFTRTDERTMLYRFTINDPSTFSKSWSGELPFNKMDDLIYEYACHEGNYALSNILSGERQRDRERDAAKPKP